MNFEKKRRTAERKTKPKIFKTIVKREEWKKISFEKKENLDEKQSRADGGSHLTGHRKTE